MHDFIVVNSQLHDQFDLFKTAEVKKSYSLVPTSELLLFYCASQCPGILNSKVMKYGKVYLDLHYSEVDKLIFWVDETRERYYGTEGERIFENAAKSMLTKLNSQAQGMITICNYLYYLSGIYIILRVC